MKISIKTLSGDLFQIDAESSDQVSVLKSKIQEKKNELAAERQKLIHAGKVLKDTQTLSELGISESDFIVCMVPKEVAKKPAPAPVAAPITNTTPSPVSNSAPIVSTTTTTTTTTVAPVPVVAPTPSTFESPEAVQALVGMGFPEEESRAALNAAMGNPDLAYEFLLTGIPPNLASRRAAPSTAATNASPVASNASGIEQLRQHPQFNMLKQLIQQNPASLPQVLDLIGQQNPTLLAAIHADESGFISMMNEPITNTPAPTTSAPSTNNLIPPGAGGGGPDPMQMIQMLAAMPPAQRAAFAETLGMSPAQLEGFMTMMAQMPPAELQSMLSAGGLGRGGGGADPPGVIRLTEDEMAAVNRLVGLGFTQQQAAQAYLACDKNEDQAANLLLEGGWADDDGDMGGFGGGPDDDMYN
eukprot:gene11441-15328_t